MTTMNGRQGPSAFEDGNPFCLVTIERASQLTGMSKRQMERLIEEGKVPTWRPSPRVIRIPYFVLLQWIAAENGMEVAAPVLPVADPPLQSRQSR